MAGRDPAIQWLRAAALQSQIKIKTGDGAYLVLVAGILKRPIVLTQSLGSHSQNVMPAEAGTQLTRKLGEI